MEGPVFIDTGAFYALADPTDRQHQTAVDLLAHLDTQDAGFVTSTFVLAESYGLILQRLRRQAARAFLSGTRRSAKTTLVLPSEGDLAAAEEILGQYDDQDFSYVDAVSFALIARLRIRRAFAFDSHFTVFRPRSGPLILNR
jgi:predicted nucleic acid-binding protein